MMHRGGIYEIILNALASFMYFTYNRIFRKPADRCAMQVKIFSKQHADRCFHRSGSWCSQSVHLLYHGMADHSCSVTCRWMTFNLTNFHVSLTHTGSGRPNNVIYRKRVSVPWILAIIGRGIWSQRSPMPVLMVLHLFRQSFCSNTNISPN